MKTGLNPAPIPFSITPDAEEYLRDCLKEFPGQARPVLMMTDLQTDGLNPSYWRYEGRSFVVGYFDITDKNKKFIESELLGRRVAVESDTLKHLSGRSLGLREVASNRGIWRTKKFVLVADPGPNPGRHGSKLVTSPEELRRRLSIGAMTILGGFTGMGVIWILSALVTMMLRISLEWVATYMMPLFAVGWIAGAIISFNIFKSVFKTSGRTKLAQEEMQQKYLGYGGLDAELGWWVFLGIPVPLTAGLIFAIEPFARTNEEKSGIAVGALVVVLAAALYICDRLPHRLVSRLGIFGWILTLVLGFWYFRTHGL